MKAAKTSEVRPKVTSSGPGAIACGVAARRILKRRSAYSATLRRSPESTAEIGVGPSAWASGSQACSGARPTLVPYPSSRKMKARLRSAGSKPEALRDQDRPGHRVDAFADHRPRRHVDEDRSEERERDPDAAEDEVFPGRLERLRGAVDADHEHGRQRRELDRDPHQPDAVRHEREVHAEHHRLVHGVVEAQIGRRQPTDLELVRDVAGAEHAGGEADERVEHDEYDIEVVDVEIRPGSRPLEEQQHRRGKRDEAGDDVERAPKARTRAGRSGWPPAAIGTSRTAPSAIEAEEAHRRSPRKRSSACTSTVSKRSRMRNRKMPMTMKAIRIENATLISTTSGMPLAPVAARMRPFSSDMKPTTWLTALRRVTIMRSPSSTTASAKARSSRASGSAPGRDAQHHHHRERDEPHAGEHRRTDANDGLDFAVDAEPDHHAMERDRDDDRLEDEGDRRRDVEMRRVLHVRLPGDRQRQHEGVDREHVQEGIEPVLIQHREADEHEPAGQEMREIEGEAVHVRSFARRTAGASPRRPEHQRRAEEFRHAEHAHLGD